MAQTFDYVIVGGGIAAASIGYELARFGRVAILEREEQPGYHSTGRSAALFTEGYGPRQVRALTMASRAFFNSPPEGFSDYPLLTPRGTLVVATPDQADHLINQYELLSGAMPSAKLLDAAAVRTLVPVLRPERVIGGIFDPAAADMDVHAIHQGFLRGFRRAGGVVVCNAEVTALRQTGGVWFIRASGTEYQAPIVLNAAGAWADVVARMAGVTGIGLEPRRRSAFIFAPPADLKTSEWPAVIGLSQEWYFKPDAGMLLGSPANADPVEPQDVQPEEFDIALGIHRIEEMTTLTIHRPTRSWAGLRSFVADGELVGGFDPEAPGFFWVAAQGGYGIQTCAAMAEACGVLVRREPFPARLESFGLDAAMLSPARLRATQGTAAAASTKY
jgi:D-arginine dehydrogenase